MKLRLRAPSYNKDETLPHLLHRLFTLIRKKYLTRRPALEASKELLNSVKFMCKTDKERFVGVFEAWAIRWEEFLKERTKEDHHTGKTHYTHDKLRSVCLSIKRNMPYLWTWYDHPPASCGIPNTNNGLEGKFTDLKTKLQNHNGLSIKHRIIFIDTYSKGTNK